MREFKSSFIKKLGRRIVDLGLWEGDTIFLMLGARIQLNWIIWRNWQYMEDRSDGEIAVELIVRELDFLTKQTIRKVNLAAL